VKTTLRIIIGLLILLVITSCTIEFIDLPNSDFVEKLPKVGINRNIFIKIKNNHIYSNDFEIHNLNDLKDSLHRYTSPHNGSNRFTYIIQASKECSGDFIDSLFYQFSKHNMRRLFLQTNQINDSVGIMIHLPFIPNINDKILDISTISFNSLTINSSDFVLNNKPYSLEVLQKELTEIVKNKEFIEIDVTKLNMYQDLITLLSKYNIALYKFRRTVSQYEFNICYDDLYEKEWKRVEIDNRVPNKLLIK